MIDGHGIFLRFLLAGFCARQLAEGIAPGLPGLKQGYSTWIYYQGLT
jgi:hypothetical protein